MSHRRALSVWVCVCVYEGEREKSSALLLLTWKPVYTLKLNVSVMKATSQCREVYVSKSCIHSFIYWVCVCVCVCVCRTVKRMREHACTASSSIVGNMMKARGIRLCVGSVKSPESASKHPAGLKLPVHCWFLFLCRSLRANMVIL